MKKISNAVFLALVIGFAASPLYADTVDFQVTAEVPAASGVSIVARSASPATPDTLSPVAGTTLDFGELVYSAADEIYLPNIFFAIDVSGTGGAGSPDVTVTYAETVAGNPNAAVGKNGLGSKATATFTKVTFGDTPADTVVSGLAAHGPKKLLKDVNENVDNLEIAGGILRVFVGIVSFDPGATFPDPATAEAFTNADQPGTYSGTLTVTATVL